MAIEVVNRQRLVSIDRRHALALARDALAAIGRAGQGVTIAFVRDRSIRKLNLDFRGKDRPTDVLSFPSREEAGSAAASGPISIEAEMADHLGDVVISADTALRQAEEAGHSFEREASELLIHGILHLCGYDHETDRGEMNRLELRLRRELLDRARGVESGPGSFPD
ncbi:MAG TPA: rRNA maturation RNase YbeY [Blastocatellia bacterium]|nr:rRNA maturation RNase YbeY [Blastocatellia bacterium]